MTSPRQLRVLRGLAAAGMSTFVALFSHVVGGGEVPGWLGIVAPLAVALLVCIMLAGKQLSLTRLTLAVATSQALFHSLFVLGAGHGSVHGSGHHHAAITVTVGGAAVPTPDASMWAAHALAALLTIAALYRGERVLRGLLALARRTARRFARIIGGVAVPVFSRAGAVPIDLHQVVAARPVFSPSTPRRGPPLLAA